MTTPDQDEADTDTLKRFATWGLRSFLALLPAGPGMALAAYGDSQQRPWLVGVGVALFLVGFAWIGYCSVRGGMDDVMRGDGGMSREARRGLWGMPLFAVGGFLAAGENLTTSTPRLVVGAVLVALGFGWMAFFSTADAMRRMESIGVSVRPSPQASGAIVAPLMAAPLPAAALFGFPVAVGFVVVAMVVLWGLGISTMLQIRAAARTV